ncbi:MAG: bifunctional folylpolyglutamate synthase/dihydrofolate synthase [candidate division KSB1 bacterium]|nr:bifunctional folylpolyglutamate synthase/dihydrofolate synthase [candidate division KSB1 bacterium]MDZ7334487.1 bifunctional folylpolyglutamate synthase/dihydrofolate synthase [candidate division KSB1 bacterium]MDZ7356014.1 bifunctional folylpolyglutamate synthase/dihydrofolate synthase [candidate division KSB1 bacterium]MDZ7377123.1 bifunctional folylpolyglutamate synthase/dihydrofolate synthase [candidate division KSB1 bacterium]MDZ7400652.1 bifunctional folylpolyglutamate synthase/dihydro
MPTVQTQKTGDALNNHSDEALNYLSSLTRVGWKLGLNKIRTMLSELHNPHEKYFTIHIAGTNGKGSTSAMLESMLRAAGYRTGLYTSPHLVYVGERIRCDGKAISREELISYITQLRPLIQKYKCTFFEAVTAIAFLYFAERAVDVAVIEVGLGGRLDATNVIHPLLSIITGIEIDHTKQLGSDRTSIAFEKAGIIKPGVICLTYSHYPEVNQVFQKVCKENHAEHIQMERFIEVKNVELTERLTTINLGVNGCFFPQLKLSLVGAHQIQNAGLAVAAATILNKRFFPIKNEDIYHGLIDVQWPGRLQTISQRPKIVLDVGHNPDGILHAAKAIQGIFKFERLIVLFGVCRDKDYPAMVATLAPMADLFIATKADSTRALSPRSIAAVASRYSDRIYQCPTSKQAIMYALQLAQPNDLILCIGSHYLVGEIISYFNQSMQ